MTSQKKPSNAERLAKGRAGGRAASGAAQVVALRASASLKLSGSAKAASRVLKAGDPAGQPKGRGLPELPDLFLEEVQRHLVLPPKAKRVLRDSFRDIYERQMKEAWSDLSVESVVPDGDRVLTTQQAADLVGVSRPFMAARIDAGDVPLFQQVGNQRRVLASQVQAWHERSRVERREVLRLLASNSDEEYPDEV